MTEKIHGILDWRKKKRRRTHGLTNRVFSSLSKMVQYHHFHINMREYSARGKQNLFPDLYGCPNPSCPYEGRLRHHGFYERHLLSLLGTYLIVIQRYINATSFSILQRLHVAQKQWAPNGMGCRFHLMAPWQIDINDELADLVSNIGGGIRFNKLFSGGEKSKMGKVRVAWRNHFGLANDDELRVVLQPLRILANSDSYYLLNR